MDQHICCFNADADLRARCRTMACGRVSGSLQRDIARLGFVVSQIKEIEEARQERLEQEPETRPHAMVRHLARGHCQVGSFDRVWQALSMTTSPNPYRGFRFPPAVIEHAVWLYHCFSLSLRDVELILSARGIVVSYESIREWGLRFGRIFANALKRRRPQPGDKWYMDEVFIRIRGKQHYLWRAVDQAGNVLDILVQSRRNAAAAMRFFRKLLKGLRYVPRVSSQTSSRATPPPNARSYRGSSTAKAAI